MQPFESVDQFLSLPSGSIVARAYGRGEKRTITELTVCSRTGDQMEFATFGQTQPTVAAHVGGLILENGCIVRKSPDNKWNAVQYVWLK